MAESKRAVVTLFLRGVALTYFFAFASLFYELPALFLETGIFPLKPTMKRVNAMVRHNRFASKPTLLWFVKWGTKNAAAEAWIPIGLDLACTILCLVAMVAAIVAILGFPPKSKKVSVDLAHRGVFFVLWAIWLSFVTVGAPLLGQDWDKLLLEVGFICIFLSPFENAMLSNETGFAFLRWMLFRVVFTQGATKFIGGDSDWHHNTALDHFWHTTPLPTSLGWVLDSIHWRKKQMILLGTYFIELVVPLMFFAPFRRLRISAGLAQVVFQIVMMLSANFNFYNMLMILATFCLYDDRFLATIVPFGKGWVKLFAAEDPESQPKQTSRIGNRVRLLCEVFVWVVAGMFAIRYITYGKVKGLQWKKGNQYAVKFSLDEFGEFASDALVVAAALCVLDFAWTTIGALRQYGKKARSSGVRAALTFALITGQILIFANSLPTASRILDKPGQLKSYVGDESWSAMESLERATANYRISNSYDWFVNLWGQRTELVFQYIYDERLTVYPNWQNFDLHFKPQNDQRDMVPFIAPFSPRIDWQLQDATKEPAAQNAWIMHILLKILRGDNAEVMKLFKAPEDFQHDKPPKFMRVTARNVRLTSPEATSLEYKDWPERSWQPQEKAEELNYVDPTRLNGQTDIVAMLKPLGWDKEPKRKSIVFRDPMVSLLTALRELLINVIVGAKAFGFMLVLSLMARFLDSVRAGSVAGPPAAKSKKKKVKTH